LSSASVLIFLTITSFDMSRFVATAFLVACLASSSYAAIPLIREGNMTAPGNGTAGKNGTNTTAAGNATTSNSTNKSSNSTCFPADATVTTFAGAVKRMDELLAGDRVHVGRGQFSEVFMFTHKTADVESEFVVVDTASSGSRLRLSPGHYMYVNGALAAAKTVSVGDSVELGDGSMDTVSAVSAAVLKGLYNPQTLQGDIVVDNVRASTYTTAVEPMFAHVILTPLRAAYRMLGWSTGLLNEGSTLSGSMPSGASVC
jgi:Hint module